MHDPAPPVAAGRRGGTEPGVIWFDELDDFARWMQSLPQTDLLAGALTHVAAAPPAPAGVADPHLLEPVDQGEFERAAAADARARPGISVLRNQRLAECVRALADGRSPQQVLAAARARDPYDSLVDFMRPVTMACLQVGRAFGRSEALRAMRRELE